jgi:S-adenosylmethionine/arginine decarboxylase-like enzyme
VNDHLHMVLTAYVANPPTDVAHGEEWLRELVALVGMKVLIDPQVVYCDDPENAGLTGFVGLTTSHASFHAWDRVAKPFIQMDLYSCRKFDPAVVVRHLAQFEPTAINYQMINRNP